jgi:hypothetical protein
VVELETISGLPAHPLFAHLPVVIIPLAGLLAIVCAVRPRWLDRFGLGLVALTALGAAGAVLAAGSGEAFEDIVEDRGQPMTKVLRAHIESGEVARTMSIVFFLIVAAVVFGRRLAQRPGVEPNAVRRLLASRAGAVAMSALVAVAAAGATATVADAGHKGAESVWSTDAGTPIDEGDDDHDADEDYGDD